MSPDVGDPPRRPWYKLTGKWKRLAGILYGILTPRPARNSTIGTIRPGCLETGNQFFDQKAKLDHLSVNLLNRFLVRVLRFRFLGLAIDQDGGEQGREIAEQYCGIDGYSKA